MFSIQLWKNGYFTRFCSGATLSLIGNWFFTIANAVLIFRLTDQVSSVALVLVAQVLPRVLFAPLGGALADRFERRRLLFTLDSARAVVALLPLLVHDAASVWLIYAAVLLLQTSSCVYNPAQSAYIATLVEDSLLESANAVYMTIRDVTVFVGPALATFVVSLWGPAAAFGGNSLSFAISAGVLLTLPHGARGVIRSLSPRALATGYAAIVQRYPRVAALYLCYVAAIAPICYFQSIMVVYTKALGEPTTFLGMLYTAAGLGGAIGGIVMGQYLRRIPYGVAVIIFALSVPLLGSVALIHQAWLAFLLIVCSTATGMAGDLVFTVNVQRYVLPEERGRAFGMWIWCAAIGQLIGACVSITVATSAAVTVMIWVSLAALPIVLAGVLLSVNAKQPANAVPINAAVKVM